MVMIDFLGDAHLGGSDRRDLLTAKIAKESQRTLRKAALCARLAIGLAAGA